MDVHRRCKIQYSLISFDFQSVDVVKVLSDDSYSFYVMIRLLIEEIP